jgi:tetratricopeptide (TPR) repeat protein
MVILYRPPQTAPLIVMVGLLAVMLVCVEAHAQAGEATPAEAVEPRADEVEPPWAQGVPPERRAEAQRLLEQGNALFLRGDHRAALTTYQEALKSWDHPAIRFNLARALIQLDRTIEAYDNVEQALRHGKSALEDHVYTEAQGYLRLLRGQIGEIDVRCTQPGTEVRVDGRPFLSCPGEKRERLLPGTHVLLTSGPGYLPESRDVLVQAGAPQTISVKLTTLSDATRTQRRWDVWKPWAVVGGGVAMAGLAGLLRWQAKRHNAEYGDDVARLCGDMPCRDGDLPLATRNLDRRAERENKSALAVGGLAAATTVAGLVLVFLNPARPIAAVTKRSAAVVAPLLSREVVGAAFTTSF